MFLQSLAPVRLIALVSGAWLLLVASACNKSGGTDQPPPGFPAGGNYPAAAPTIPSGAAAAPTPTAPPASRTAQGLDTAPRVGASPRAPGEATDDHAATVDPEAHSGSCDYYGPVCSDSYVNLTGKSVRLSCNGNYSRGPCSSQRRTGRCAFRGPREDDTHVDHYYTPLEVAKPDCLKRGGAWTPDR